MNLISKSVELGGKTLTFEVGRFAEQANAAVLARMGDTMVLATVVASRQEPNLGYFPLDVEYQERLYAGGRIKGSRWVKREGRPSDEAILTGRLVDRSIRPLFPHEYKNEVQVIITVLSVDAENSPDILALCATSAALAISNIPWDGPIGGVRVGYIPKDGSGTFIVNPTHQDLQYSEADLIVSTTKKAIVMLEGGAKEVSEEILLKAMDFAQKEGQKIIKVIEELVAKVGQKKLPVVKEEIDTNLISKIEKEAKSRLVKELKGTTFEKESVEFTNKVNGDLVEIFGEEQKNLVAKIVNETLKKIIRDGILKDGKRPDGRKTDEIRPITIEVGVLPRTHGSAMFKRGSTQALTITTLGAPSLGQLIESMEGEETKRYIHHYSMPPFSIGEVGRMSSASRREIGHGALAERALEPVIPADTKFPYTIRVVSEIMSSNGSTSMASVCGSTLSLMDAGVPIKAPVAGIAMGMIAESEKKAVILTDIIGLEDFNGDMDFKVAGTEKGVTAIQMDVKNPILTIELLGKALAQAKEARLFILDKMLKALPSPRVHVSKFAPKIMVIHIPTEKIGEVIGPGGKIIRSIIAETGANVEVEDDGSINVSAPDKESVDKAVAWIEGLTKEVKVGEIYEGTVKRIQPFGAFVEILPGKEGLVHVSRMAQGFVSDPNTVVKIGQKVKVRVFEVDELHRINLSMNPEGTDQPRPKTFTRRPFSPRR
jgi:polyribonucleotide nucleotidyltransferase